jgi:hypothetical protein
VHSNVARVAGAKAEAESRVQMRVPVRAGTNQVMGKCPKAGRRPAGGCHEEEEEFEWGLGWEAADRPTANSMDTVWVAG